MGAGHEDDPIGGQPPCPQLSGALSSTINQVHPPDASSSSLAKYSPRGEDAYGLGSSCQSVPNSKALYR